MPIGMLFEHLEEVQKDVFQSTPYSNVIKGQRGIGLSSPGRLYERRGESHLLLLSHIP